LKNLDADLEVRQTTAKESKAVIIRLNLSQFLLFYTGVRCTLNPPLKPKYICPFGIQKFQVFLVVPTETCIIQNFHKNLNLNTKLHKKIFKL